MIKISPNQTRAIITGEIMKDKEIVVQSRKFGETAIKSFGEYKNNLSNLPSGDIFQELNAVLEEGSDFRKSLNSKSPVRNFADDMLDNFLNGLNELNSKLMPANFTLRYTPKQFNFMSLFGAAYENLGRVCKKPVKELNKELPQGYTYNAFADKNGNVNLSGAAAMLILEDVARKNPNMTKFDPKVISGIITEKGEQNFRNSYLKEENVKNTKNLVSQIHNFFGFDKIIENFKNSFK